MKVATNKKIKKRKFIVSKKLIKLNSLTALSLLSISIAPGLTAKADTNQTYGTQAEVTFTAGSDTTGPLDPQNPTNPTDPTNPVNPVTPTDPDGTDPDGGGDAKDASLTIDYASSFDFGTHAIENKAATYTAAAQKLSTGDTRTNYVQVTDNRGTFAGWNVKVKMTDFTTTDTKIPIANRTLKGATVTLGDAAIQGAATSNPADKFVEITKLTPGTQSPTIIGASAGHGTGTSLLDFGGTDGATKDTAVKLSVPAGVAGAAKYTADLTWTLDNTPAN